jgi:hypothetical protein
MTSPRAKIEYQSGDWFAIPLRPSGFGVGVIARGSRNGVLFGYFFPIKSKKVPDLKATRELKSKDAILLARFGDLALRNRRWALIGRFTTWNEREWPMPPFVRRDIVSGKLALVTYKESDPGLEHTMRRVLLEESKGLPSDGLFGYRAIEIKLSHLLEGPLEKDAKVIN